MSGIAFAPADFSQYGGGWVDYSDLDFQAQTGTPISPDAPYTVTRNLVASANNTRLNRPFVGWQYWDNAAKLVRGRALDDVIGIRIDVRLVADKIDGVVRVAMNTPTIELVGVNMPLTADPGEEEKITVSFVPLEERNSFFQNGASFTISTNVPVTLNEFSPVFYPLGVGQ